MSENPAESIASSYFESEQVVSHYFREGHRVGLWRSEEVLCNSLLSENDQILDLGCGTGRIAFGLEKLGFGNVQGADFSAGMIEGARQIAEGLGSQVDFRQADARDMPWADEAFDAIVFGFNGFFMIPGNDQRIKALSEIYRVLKPGGIFIFTGHDRNLNNQRLHWDDLSKRPPDKKGTEANGDFGDVIADTKLGTMYIHSTTDADVSKLLRTHGFENIESWFRSELANERPEVREFADECRFWKGNKEYTQK